MSTLYREIADIGQPLDLIETTAALLVGREPEDPVARAYVLTLQRAATVAREQLEAVLARVYKESQT